MQYTLHGPAASCSSSETQHRGLLLPLTPGSRPSPSSLLSPQVPSLYTSTTVICVLGNDIQNKSQGPVQPRQCQSGHKLAALHQCRMTTCQPDERGLSPIRQLTPLKIVLFMGTSPEPSTWEMFNKCLWIKSAEGYMEKAR